LSLRDGCLRTLSAAVFGFAEAICACGAAFFGSLCSPRQLWSLLCEKYRKFAMLLQLDAESFAVWVMQIVFRPPRQAQRAAKGRSGRRHAAKSRREAANSRAVGPNSLGEAESRRGRSPQKAIFFPG
jgi:hypothetical protein